MAAGSIPATLAVLYLLEHIAVNATFIKTTLGVASLLTGVAMIYYDRLARKATAPLAGTGPRFGAWTTPATVLTGLAIGVLVTLSSVGAGALGTIALLFLYPRLPTVRIVGTDLAHAIPLTAIAGLGYLHMGSVSFPLLGFLLVGSLPGIYAGSHPQRQDLRRAAPSHPGLAADADRPQVRLDLTLASGLRSPQAALSVSGKAVFASILIPPFTNPNPEYSPWNHKTCSARWPEP